MSGHPRVAAAGFTLLETLVALAILGIVLTAVYGVFGSGLRTAQRDEDRLLLALVARNLLARSALDLYPGTSTLSGDIGGGLRWSIAGAPFTPPEGLLPEITQLANDPTAQARAGMSLGGGALGHGDGGGGLGSGSSGGGSGFGAGSSSGFGTGSSGAGGSSGFGSGLASSGSSSGGSGFGSGSSGLGGSASGSSGSGFGGGSGLGDQDGLGGGSRLSGGTGEAGADGSSGRERDEADSTRRREREKARLLLVTVTTEKGRERFQLTGLVQEPRRDDAAAR
ncbi:MAG: type II secretion system protein [Geminicoccaceae bacterium]